MRLFFWMICFHFGLFAKEETFIVLEGPTEKVLLEYGNHLNEKVSPGSTFKIALSLIGFDMEILKDADHPVWLFEEGYDDFLETWKCPQNPRLWLKTSCAWYSKKLVL